MKQRSSGFTLMEILLVIAILAVLAAIVITNINPRKQFGDAQDAQRRSDVKAILDAIYQFSIENRGALPAEIPASGSEETCVDDGQDICMSDISCADGVDLQELLVEEKYLTTIPADPYTHDDQITGYKITQSENGRITICAPGAYTENGISITR